MLNIPLTNCVRTGLFDIVKPPSRPWWTAPIAAL